MLVGNALRLEPSFERRAVVAWLPLIQVDGQQIEGHGRLRLQRPQQHQQTVAVLPSGDGDHDPISILDEVVIADGAAHVAEEAALQIHVQPDAHATFIRAGGATHVRGCNNQASQTSLSAVGPKTAAGRMAARGWARRCWSTLGILVAFVAYGRSSDPVETASGASRRPPGGAGAHCRSQSRSPPSRWRAARRPTRRLRSRAPGMRRRASATIRSRGPARPPSVTAAIATAPAPDSGLGGGAPLDRAFRLDRSTLRARLTDGAAEAQPARLRISRRRASPQAIRREPTVGIGDSVRTVVPSRAPISLANAAADPALGGEAAGAARAGAPAALSDAQPLVARVDPDPNAAHAIGPLDAEAGRRAFDIQQAGRAADNRTQRTASDELHPGITDFSRAAAPRADRARRGARAVARARRGLATGGRHRGCGARRPRSAGARARGRRADARATLRSVHRGDPAARPPDP